MFFHKADSSAASLQMLVVVLIAVMNHVFDNVDPK